MTVEVPFPRGRTLRVLEHRAAVHDFREWERAAVESVIDYLKPGMVVYDIGAEEGEFSALWAQSVGPRNVHIFEPTPSVWPNIRRVWEANFGAVRPGGMWPGFVASAADSRHAMALAVADVWPAQASGPLQLDSRFSVVVERPDIPSVSLDEYPAAPDVIICDVEGAEVLVFAGACETLRRHRPVVFVSIHAPEFLSRFQAPACIEENRTADARRLPLECRQEHVFRIFAQAGYVPRFISEDHEVHVQFIPVEKLGPRGCHGCER